MGGDRITLDDLPSIWHDNGTTGRMTCIHCRADLRMYPGDPWGLPCPQQLAAALAAAMEEGRREREAEIVAALRLEARRSREVDATLVLTEAANAIEQGAGRRKGAHHAD